MILARALITLPDAPPQSRERHGREIHPVHFNTASLGIIESAHQFQKRGFARSILSDNSDNPPGGDCEVEVLKDWARAAGITKTHIAEGNSPFQNGWYCNGLCWFKNSGFQVKKLEKTAQKHAVRIDLSQIPK